MDAKIAVKIVLKLILSCTLLAACNSGNSVRNVQAQHYEDKCSVECTGQKVYVLDDNTSCQIDYMQLIDSDTLRRLSFLNANWNAIYLYNEATGEWMDTIVFDREGADGVGKIQGYCYHNDDSIFVYEYGSGIVSLANSKGHVIEKYQLYDEEAVAEDTTYFYPIPYLSTNNPIFYTDGKIIMNGGLMVETNLETANNTSVSMLYDLSTKKIVYANPYPEQYHKYNWGGGFSYRQPHTALDEEGNLLISFSADHNLWRYHIDTDQRDSIYAGSALIENIIPFEITKKKYPDDISAEAETDWYYGQPSYDVIYSDPYKHLYYRIARLPNPNHRFNTYNDKPLVIVVLDKDLKYIGEEQLPAVATYDPYNAYVTPDGLYIHIMTNDEDHLTFFQYNVKL